MNESPCKKLKKLIEDRAPWLVVKVTDVSDPKMPVEHLQEFCILDYRDPELEENYSLKLTGSLMIDKEHNVHNADIPIGTHVSGVETKYPTNIVTFPEKCTMGQVHMYDHGKPNIHIHLLKCEKLKDPMGYRDLADVIVRTTRRTREYAGLK